MYFPGASLYNPDVDFTCFDGSAAIPFKYVNDDYCDCQVRVVHRYISVSQLYCGSVFKVFLNDYRMVVMNLGRLPARMALSIARIVAMSQQS